MQAFSNRVIGSLWVLSDADRQTTDRQHDARRATGVDERHRFQDQASGARDDRPGLAQALTFLQPGDGRMGWKRDRLGRPAKGTRCGAPGGSSGGFGSGRKHGGGVPDLRDSAQYPLRGAEAGELKER